MPIFNKEIPAFHIKFLGSVGILCSEKELEIQLRPKDTAFLIHLAINKNRKILLDDICRNFWPKSEISLKNLAHLLVRLRKSLGLSLHLLGVQAGAVSWQTHFTTDFDLFEETLTKAKALERTGEWSFAKKEYIRAFRLFRGEPFKKNYDEWSLHMRHKILTQLETEAKNFARSYVDHKNKRDAKKVLEKVLKIIPDSEEIKRLFIG